LLVLVQARAQVQAQALHPVSPVHPVSQPPEQERQEQS
jgi:hypothetical protein